MLNYIKGTNDISYFLDSANGLHDGKIVSVQYNDQAIKITDDIIYRVPFNNKLTIRVLVTSIYNTIIEIEFENVLEWQVKCGQCEILDCSIFFNKQNLIVWYDDINLNDRQREPRI